MWGQLQYGVQVVKAVWAESCFNSISPGNKKYGIITPTFSFPGRHLAKCLNLGLPATFDVSTWPSSI